MNYIKADHALYFMMLNRVLRRMKEKYNTNLNNLVVMATIYYCEKKDIEAAVGRISKISSINSSGIHTAIKNCLKKDLICIAKIKGIHTRIFKLSEFGRKVIKAYSHIFGIHLRDLQSEYGRLKIM